MRTKKIFIFGIFTLLFFLIGLNANAQSDTVNWNKKPFLKQFNAGFEMLGAGLGYLITSDEVKNLSNGMNYFLQKPERGLAFSLFLPMIAFRDKFIISCDLFNFSSYTINGDNFETFLASKYPNYFIPEVTWIQYDFWSIKPCFLYRMHYKRWLLEPNVGWEKHSDILPEANYTLREKGSNQFIEYKIKTKNEDKTELIYFGTNLFYRFKKPEATKLNIELGLKAMYAFGNINAQYEILEKPYLKPETLTYVDYNLPIRNIKFIIGLRMFFMK